MINNLNYLTYDLNNKAYLTIARDGLTIEELMSLLNCDDRALNEAMDGTVPRDPEHFGISVLSLLRLINDCSCLLVSSLSLLYIYQYYH